MPIYDGHASRAWSGERAIDIEIEIGEALMSAALRERVLLGYTLLLLVSTAALASVLPLDHRIGDVAGFVVVTPLLGWVLLHSTVLRGAAMTGQFLLIAGGIAFGLDAVLLNLTDIMRHSFGPQIFGVAPQIIGAWIVYLYAGFAVTQALMSPARTWLSAVPFCVVAALVTTALDLTAEPVGVHLRYFTYPKGGAFMPEVEGDNGAHGIPLANYLVWMTLATGTYLVVWLTARRAQPEAVRGRAEALLFYVSLFNAAAIPALRLGYPQLVLIGGVPVALVCLLVAHRYLSDRQAREASVRRGRERARVTSLVERRQATQRH